ncbi:uncharacterized protein CEXT_714971 [Caerostris extrusa]|uniref:Uncharacterized protein n=1 Tax=Caerostris extrusa TaxID=172846 RepID=A0AAV4N3V9_CAEEX|nr:uncharacterized protein CEXT_714971 [Caerostris extrusa]
MYSDDLPISQYIVNVSLSIFNMALSSYWVSQNRKDLAERAIVSKREKDAARAMKCLEVDFYHKNLALKSSKYKNLEEGQALKTSRANDESSVKENQKLAEKERLEYRRRKISSYFLY